MGAVAPAVGSLALAVDEERRGDVDAVAVAGAAAGEAAAKERRAESAELVFTMVDLVLR